MGHLFWGVYLPSTNPFKFKFSWSVIYWFIEKVSHTIKLTQSVLNTLLFQEYLFVHLRWWPQTMKYRQTSVEKFFNVNHLGQDIAFWFIVQGI